MTSNQRTERHYDIDWLRCLAMLMVFLFHCARFFDDFPWHVKDGEISAGFSLFVGFLVIWIMPIFFLISGMSSFYSLGKRTGREFIQARIKRLAIPFVFGVFVLIPPQVYLERLSHGQFEGSFIQFSPHYFDGFYAFGGNFAWMGLHLWFLQILFIHSLLLLPLFLWIRREKILQRISRAADLLLKPGIIFLFGVPLAIIELALNPEGLGRRDFGGWNIFQYLVVFFYGYLIASNQRIRQVIKNHRVTALILGTVILTALVVFEERIGYSGTMILRAFAMWLWLLAILGFGHKYLNFSNGALKLANEAVLPFYILHQTVILILGYFIVQLGIPLFTKFLIIAVLSFVTIISLYVFLIKKFKPMRFLFGMRSS
jgi:peptidoglycan/LPS O-acetylase OafA/YrhL